MPEEIALFICVSTIALVAILTRFYLKLQELKLKYSSGEKDGNLKQQIGNLMAENEEIKEELSNIKYFLGQEKKFIDIEEYEKEQIRIDNQNKNSL